MRFAHQEYLLAATTSFAGGTILFWMTARSSDGTLAGCRGDAGCEVILKSRWAWWGPLRIGAIGAGMYFLLFVMSLSLLFQPHNVWLADTAMILAFTLSGAGVWFLFLQLAILRRVCLYCNFVHVCGVSTLLALLSGIGKDRGAEPAFAVLAPALKGLGAVAVLIAGQLLWRPKRYVVRQEKADDIEKRAASREGQSAQSHADVRFATAVRPPIEKMLMPSRELSLLAGAINLHSADWPLMGSPEAQQFVGLLFDYTCPTCRKTHEVSKALLATTGNALAILHIPVPLHPACNPMLKKVYAGRTQACQYAKLAVAVSCASPDLYGLFLDYLFKKPKLPPLGLAVSHAQELTGLVLSAYAHDEQINARISRGVEICQTANIDRIPAFLLPNAAVIGEVYSVPELQAIFKREMGPLHSRRRMPMISPNGDQPAFSDPHSLLSLHPTTSLSSQPSQ